MTVERSTHSASRVPFSYRQTWAIVGGAQILSAYACLFVLWLLSDHDAPRTGLLLSTLVPGYLAPQAIAVWLILRGRSVSRRAISGSAR